MSEMFLPFDQQRTLQRSRVGFDQTWLILSKAWCIVAGTWLIVAFCFGAKILNKISPEKAKKRPHEAAFSSGTDCCYSLLTRTVAC